MSIPSFILKSLLIFFFMTLPSFADDNVGTPFFLLSDATYGSHDTALVRLEVENVDTVSEYGGVDLYVYQIKDPIAFLKAQKNLHRINVEPNYSGGTLANALSLTWDKLWKEAREIWRKLFTQDARHTITNNIPQVRTHPLGNTSTPLILNPRYEPLKSHILVNSFRYPLHKAKSIQPPKGVELAGSSSEFLEAPQGNVMIPLGKKAPGLYLVEAMIGDYRATTLVFVSDSVAVTKVSSNQMLAWIADRRTSQPVKGADVLWSDGIGILSQNKSDQNGLVTFERKGVEKTYIYGKDPDGGIYISENYYYDSEIYNTKLYASTDRPLYRPGEDVYVEFMGRNFTSARTSTPLQNGSLKLEVFDPNGFPIAQKNVQITANGGNTAFKLPNNASAGGYGLRFEYLGNSYGASFRVSEYQKPHFEINIFPDKSNYKTNEPVTGKLQLTYPDGKPVKNAQIDMSVRAQSLSMIEGDLGYSGAFPLKITNSVIATDEKGTALFSLPAATLPSRYVLSALATDGAAYRVRATKELLIERGVNMYDLSAEKSFSSIGTNVVFGFHPISIVQNNPSTVPLSWSWLRMEDRHKDHGSLSNASDFSIVFNEPGTYTVSLHDRNNNIVGATTHYVSGGAIRAPQGSIKMVFDQNSYHPGERAKALITFSEPVDQALFTLERDRVEKTALMSKNTDWVNAKRLSPTQWQIELPVKAEYGPNITFSAVYVKGNEYVFQNLGLKVEQPRINITVRADKALYAPGEKVTLDLTALIGNKPSANSHLNLSVVDEMVYVLQSEIAPDVFDFFYHPRRNNVRTTASLSFIGYDLAKVPTNIALPSHGQTHQRAIKLQERPRRDDKDTALWNPDIITDKNGHARVSFIMPDSLTRWRITARGMDSSGIVGQNTAYVRSDKPFYIKWTSPTWMRSGDNPNASIALFNQTGKKAIIDFAILGAGLKYNQPVSLKPGINFLNFPLKVTTADSRLHITLSSLGKQVDDINIPLRILPVYWQNKHALHLTLNTNETFLHLPADAKNIKLQFTDGISEQFRRIMDDLIDYPYGCVEQTSSRIIPYTLALLSLQNSDEKLSELLRQRLYTFRFRLAQMAGPDATFGWWSTPIEEGDPFLTTYAYYADWHASKALNLNLPEGHFDILLDIYRKNGANQTPWKRALMLDWMQQMGLPVGSLAAALVNEVAQHPKNSAKNSLHLDNSVIMTADTLAIHDSMALLLSAYTVRATQGKLNPSLNPQLTEAVKQIHQASFPVGEALLMLCGNTPSSEASDILDKVRVESPTIDRAVTLLWVYRALEKEGISPLLTRSNQTITPDNSWKSTHTFSGQNVYYWAKTAIPASIHLSDIPKSAFTAVIRYDSAETGKSTLPVQVERRFYRLNKFNAESNDSINTNGSAQYDLEPMGKNSQFDTNELYLDQITITSHSSTPLHFGIVEAALPPGMSADSATWGVNIRYPGGESYGTLEKARFDLSVQGYSVPVDTLEGTTVIRHLIRPAQTGTFLLPPARYYKMYQPDQKAFEETPRAVIQIH
ncbi:MAG: alpha-2-macroglobulin family protein [Sulfuricurvum sp.]|uniref:alpha-2-macroglobulin family protein n=1 Tax=Sulfuricurvum sp. TaxID=2025608 RepID=UPI00260DA27B|nr:MG2 domain-containing protein [Sulfuricurvum sp.]MDD5118335.1 alpha-2-macroglobulin family protein [Sulfuricurvum sp.]